MECSKSFSIAVNVPSECPVWATDLVWDVPTITTGGSSGAANFTPSGVAGDVFTMDATADGSPGDFGQIETTGVLTYDGSGCNCQVVVNVSNPALVDAVLGGQIGIIIPPATVIMAAQTFGSMAAGDNTLLFTLPDTLGVPTIFWVQITLLKDDTDPGGTITITGTFSNV